MANAGSCGRIDHRRRISSRRSLLSRGSRGFDALLALRSYPTKEVDDK
jgi:hypothetical protein